MIRNRVQAVLFLWEYPFFCQKCFGQSAVSRFGNRMDWFYRPWSHFFLRVFHKLEEIVPDFFFAKGILQIAGSGFCAGLIIAVCGKETDHGMDVKGNLVWICIVCNMNTKLWIWSKSAGTVNGKCPVFFGYKSKVTECGMNFIRRGIGKTDFQFSGHVKSRHLGQEIFSGSLCIRKHIKCLIHSGTSQRTCHDITRVVASAAVCDDADF